MNLKDDAKKDEAKTKREGGSESFHHGGFTLNNGGLMDVTC